MFLGLAVFLFLRSDPEVWPLGDVGFFASLRDVEVLQHRVFVVLVIVFALFEWRVRTGRLADRRAALVFPVLTAAGGLLLFTHTHAIANVRSSPRALYRSRHRIQRWNLQPISRRGRVRGRGPQCYACGRPMTELPLPATASISPTRRRANWSSTIPQCALTASCRRSRSFR